MFKVTFAFENGSTVEAFANAGDNLLEVARGANVAIDAPCSGNGACGKCRVQLKSGELDSKKTLHISDEEFEKGWRLACMSKISADVEVLVPDIASAYKSRMKVADLSSREEIAIFEKAKNQVEETGIQLRNSLEVVELQMTEPTLDDTMPDVERLTRALRKFMNLKRIRVPYAVLRKLPDVLRASKFSVKCVVRVTPDDMFVYDIFDAKEDVIMGGLAVDIGTTTVSAVIINMATGEILAKSSSGNGQIRYGADVINRIIETTKPGGIKKLQDAVIKETINPMIHEMCRSIHLPENQIYRMCVASNTTMNHLFAGINADYLRTEPYIPAFFKTNSLFASDVGIEINGDAHIIMAPNIGSYVGGDITAGTLVSMIWNRPEFSLFIDLGTNGELVFGNSDFMMSCACSAGPAFEGGNISCGMPGVPGAVCRAVLFGKNNMVTKTIGNKPAIGLCGTGIIDVMYELVRHHIVDTQGILGEPWFEKGFPVVPGKIYFTQEDIRQVQMAKAAICAGLEVLLQKSNISHEQIKKVYVAGGFGMGLDMEKALGIGLLPIGLRGKLTPVGNSALEGAARCLTHSKESSDMQPQEIAAISHEINLADTPEFQELYLKHMQFC